MAQARFEFYMKEIVNDEESVKAGKPVFRYEEWVRVIKPNGHGVPDETPMPIGQARQMMDEVRRRTATVDNDPDATLPVNFDRGYAAFKAGESAPVNGTPLKQWPNATADVVVRCERQGLKSVEDLASASEPVLNGVGPGSREWQKRARAWLDAAEGPGKLAAELAALRSQVEAQGRVIEKQNEAIAKSAKKPEKVAA